MTKKILIVATSAPELKGYPTGLWLEEIAAPYFIFMEAGYEITIASPAGGPIPIDANSLRDPFFTDAAKKFLYDADAMHMFNHSMKLESVALPGDFDAFYMPGGHGCCTDCVNNPTVKAAIETMYNAGKIVTCVCHGPVALAECNKPDGTPLVQGLTVTGFTDSEEEAVQHVDKVPFLIETRFKEQGANYEKGDDWNPKVCRDGNLITGQNPASSDLAAKTVVEALES